MSIQNEPCEYDAVLGGGQNPIPQDAPVLGGLDRIKRQLSLDNADRLQLLTDALQYGIQGETLIKESFACPNYGEFFIDLVKGYEVQERPLWQWEYAILEGFRIFRELKTHRGGIVTADLNTHTITFETLK